MLSKKQFLAYLKDHAKRDPHFPSFWIVTKPLAVFKKVYTYYDDADGKALQYRPHTSVPKLKRRFEAHYSNCGTPAEEAIANLIIPVGAEIHINLDGTQRKFRADKALCHSIARTSDEKPVAYGVSGWDSDFIYVNGAMVGREIELVPSQGFSTHRDTCAGGIHFYLELDSALNH